MKRGISLLLIPVMLSFLMMACVVVRGAATQKDGMPTIIRYGVTSGLVWVNGDDVTIVANYKSRSRVDYKVTGDLKGRIAALDGQVVTVEGATKRQGWSGTIEVVRILKPKKSPGPSNPVPVKNPGGTPSSKDGK